MRGQQIDITARFQEQLANQAGAFEPFLWAMGFLFVLSALLPKHHRRRASRQTRSSYNRTSQRVRHEPKVYDDEVSYGAYYEGSTPIQREMMTSNEVALLRTLVEAFPNCHVCPQVSFNALITHGHWRQRWMRKYFNTYSADYVLYHFATGGVLAVIELDGTSHNSARQQAKDRMRDSMLLAAGYFTIRLDDRDTYSVERLRDIITPTQEQF
jgi:hypothetical protein